MKKDPIATKNLGRRGFLKTSGAMLGAAGLAGIASGCRTASSCDAPEPATRSMIAKNDVILFQGDSITDMGRSRSTAAEPNNESALGNGYAALAALELLTSRPGDGLKIYNRGVSGNKVFQLAERWQADCLDLKPDVLSILIGVNDIWHTLNGKYNGTVEIYERDYRALMERTKKALPNAKLILCEPFVLRVGAVNDRWFPEFDHYREAAARVAAFYGALFIPFQAMFDDAIKFASPGSLVKDGVHPTTTGASLMAYNWLKAVRG